MNIIEEKLTKEECEKYLLELKQYIFTSSQETLNANCCEQIQCFEQLIDEHFDNPPLKFDELEKGMWIWDDQRKMYYQLDKIEGNKMYHTNWIDGIFPKTFEENRFYRKQGDQ